MGGGVSGERRGGTSEISLIASSVLELPIRLHDCKSIVTSIILSESGFGEHIGVRANWGDLKAKSANDRRRRGTGVSRKEGMGRLLTI